MSGVRKRGSRAIQPPQAANSGSEDEAQQQTDAQPQPAAEDASAAVVAEQKQPPVKRTRRDESGTPADAVLAVATAAVAPMLRLLKRDVHAVHSVLRMLEFDDLILLASTCRTWREWIEHPPAHLLETFALEVVSVESKQLIGLARSPIRAYFVDLRLSDRTAASLATTSEVLRALPSFTRLTSLDVELSHPAVDAKHVRACFAGLSGRLTSLHLCVSHYKSLSTLVLREVALRQLRSLQLTTTSYDGAQEVDLSFLASLLALETFHFYCGLRFSCSLAQTKALAQCKSITDVDCGSWSTFNPYDSRSAEQQLQEDRLGTLVRGQIAIMHERGLTVPPLTNLGLGLTVIDSAVLDQLLRLADLTSIQPIAWSDDITPSQWARLGLFTHLKDIKIGGSTRKKRQMELFLPSVLQCSQLTSLHLYELVTISSTQPRDICTQLTKLVDLYLADMAIESLQPLELMADRCKHLSFYNCTGLTGVPLDVRTNLPAMVQLLEFSLHEPRDHRLDPAVAEPLNRRLLERCPQLDMEVFEGDSELEDEHVGSDFE